MRNLRIGAQLMDLVQLPACQLSGNSAVCQCGDNLPNLLGTQISGNKDTGNGGAAVLSGDDIAVGINFYHLSVKRGVRREADGNEYPG